MKADNEMRCIERVACARHRTAARLWAMRKALNWYAEHMPNQYENNYAALDIELRRQAVQEVRDNA